MRKVPLPGYPKPFRLYCLIVDRAVVVSYSPSLEGRIDTILEAFKAARVPREAKVTLSGIFPDMEHSHKFAFGGTPPVVDNVPVTRLRKEHFEDFLDFFRAQHPGNPTQGWLEDYFMKLVEGGYAFGVFEDGRLVSATDAPDVPYMGDVMVEIGINTREGCRRRGYGRRAVTALLEHLISRRKAPLWSCRSTNLASESLALSVGFQSFAEVLAIRSASEALP